MAESDARGGYAPRGAAAKQSRSPAAGRLRAIIEASFAQKKTAIKVPNPMAAEGPHLML